MEFNSILLVIEFNSIGNWILMFGINQQIIELNSFILFGMYIKMKCILYFNYFTLY